MTLYISKKTFGSVVAHNQKIHTSNLCGSYISTSSCLSIEVFMVPLETPLLQTHVLIVFGTISMGPNQG
jgi:hypothetical protein